MSVKIMAAVWPYPMPTSHKIVLLKLADCASDDGCNAYPTVARIAAETGLSERTVRYTLRSLEEDGFVALEREAGQHKARSYRVVAERIQGGNDCPRQPLPPATDDAGGQLTAVRGATTAPDPSVNHHEIHQSGANAPTPLFSDLEEPQRHRPITDKYLTELQAENPDVDVRAIYDDARNRKTWDGYHDKRRALRDRVQWARERRDRFSNAPPAPKANPAGVTRIDDPNYAANWVHKRQRTMQ